MNGLFTRVLNCSGDYSEVFLVENSRCINAVCDERPSYAMSCKQRFSFARFFCFVLEVPNAHQFNAYWNRPPMLFACTRGRIPRGMSVTQRHRGIWIIESLCSTRSVFLQRVGHLEQNVVRNRHRLLFVILSVHESGLLLGHESPLEAR